MAHTVPMSLSLRDAVGALFAGLVASLRPGPLRRKVLRALLINAVGLLVVVATLVYLVFALIGVPGGSDVIGSLVAWAIRLLALVLIVVAVPLLYVAAGRLLALATNQGIFEVARRQAGAPDPVEEPLPLSTSTGLELRRLGRFLMFSAALLPMNIIPIMGAAIYAAATMVLASRAMGWDLLAYHFEAHGMGHEAQKAWVHENRRLVLVFGAVAMLMCMVPVLQLLTITTHVAGAGILSARLDAD